MRIIPYEYPLVFRKWKNFLKEILRFKNSRPILFLKSVRREGGILKELYWYICRNKFLFYWFKSKHFTSRLKITFVEFENSIFFRNFDFIYGVIISILHYQEMSILRPPPTHTHTPPLHHRHHVTLSLTPPVENRKISRCSILKISSSSKRHHHFLFLDSPLHPSWWRNIDMTHM